MRQSPALLPFTGSRRSRRRGPRSQLALLRRSVPKHRRTLPDTCPGESRHSVSEPIDENASSQGNVLPNMPDIQCLHEFDASVVDPCMTCVCVFH